MTVVYFDPTFDERVRRERLFDGDLIVNTPTDASRALCEFARSQIAQSFGSLDPETAQYEMPVEQYAALLSDEGPLPIVSYSTELPAYVPGPDKKKKKKKS